jgi:hypothetical protein
MINAVKVIYSDYIPDELIQDFRHTLKGKLTGEVQVIKNKHEYENFTGSEFSDIAIYIEQHITEIIISGVIGNAAYSVVKHSLVKLWAGFRAFIKKRNIVKEGDQLAITVNFHNQEKEIEIVLQGDIEAEDLEKIINRVFDFLQSDLLIRAFEKADNIEVLKNKPKIRLIFNEETKQWEPENFGEWRRQMDKFRDWATQNIMD